MPNRIEGYIGCPKCRTTLFRLESEPAQRPGVFSHVKVALGDTPAEAQVCPVGGCGTNLARVPAPA